MDMEVAGHWRREWAGTAEFGNVTEGGVTRRVARAMEVLHASAPGTKVRVMRAAYHSSAGNGTPASSYLMHSSRRVISSGFNFLESPSIANKPFVESPTTPIKPLEISSMPLDDLPNGESTKYKVTEPDDTEISEPSKWRGSTEAGSLRFPSEESSSTDNASIVDLDWKKRGGNRKSSCDSESSDFQYKRNSIDIPIRLSSPTLLSSLKFKSLLNAQQNDWNNRRKSYSFEDTEALNESVIQSNDTLAMESSTDSGICKSTELVNEQDAKYSKKSEEQSDDYYDREKGSFQDWLSRNRRNSYHKSNRTQAREHNIIVEDFAENNITLRSPGKVTITVPITLEKDENADNKLRTNEDAERRVKRVEFCKTELHFAADSGKVNIIATDDKPPPSNDFRKRRSAFVPLNENFEKPITLFGEKSKTNFNTNHNLVSNTSHLESSENDENTAATKSILKNKIPKPKPYLLGENMALGVSNDIINKKKLSTETYVPSAVLLINRQLQAGRTTPEEDGVNNLSKSVHSHRTVSNSPVKSSKVSSYRSLFEKQKQTETIQKENPILRRSPSPVKSRYNVSHLSPTTTRAHTRQLRDSDLIYFGVNKEHTKSQHSHTNYYELPSQDEDVFQSVKLVQKISSSVCNSEAESEDYPEYQNISFKSNFTPVPAPRTSRLKDIEEDIKETRRSRTRKVLEQQLTSNRSISEPPKFGRNSLERANQRRQKKHLEGDISSARSKKQDEVKKMSKTIHEDEDSTFSGKESPLYVNIGMKNDHHESTRSRKPRPSSRTINNTTEQHLIPDHPISKVSPVKRERIQNKEKKDIKCSPDNQYQSLKSGRKRTEKLVTPEHSDENHPRSNGDTRNSIRHKRSTSANDGSTSRRKVKDVDKGTINSISSSYNTASKRESRTGEGLEKETRKRRENESVDRNKSSRVTEKNPSTGSKVTTLDISSKNSRKETAKKATPATINDNHISTRLPEGKGSKYRKSEYVINYDDKNGTVSSICKIKPCQPALKRHIVPKELKDKASDKISLLQLPERHWIQNEHSHADRKSKKKINIQRSCQLL